MSTQLCIRVLGVTTGWGGSPRAHRETNLHQTARITRLQKPLPTAGHRDTLVLLELVSVQSQRLVIVKGSDDFLFPSAQLPCHRKGWEKGSQHRRALPRGHPATLPWGTQQPFPEGTRPPFPEGVQVCRLDRCGNGWCLPSELVIAFRCAQRSS